jgi:serine/threonine protein kinase/ABC-type nitrate/sulfonate/bicarbonate transport system substrate-binding protein
MRLGPYELVRQIGAGGMGEVWAAHRAATGPREVLAVKRLPKQLARDPAYRRILLEEARLSMLLRHRNIVHVFDAGEADGEAYIAMEFVQGLDLSRLRKLLDQTGEGLSPTAVAFIIGEVLEGLDYAHNLEKDGKPIALVHRDVSPHNVMLSTRGEVKLTDFGVARLSSEDTSGTHVKGKARYMPPEQLRGESRSPKVDLFAAGAVLHELLDGSVFRGDAIDDARLLGMAIDGVVPQPRRSLASYRELEQLRRGLLQTDAKKRMHTAQAALELLHRWSGYSNAAAEVGDLVRRYLDLQVSLERDPTQTALAQPAAPPQNNDEIGLDEFGGLDGIDALPDPWGEPAHTGPELLLRRSSEGDSEFDFQLEDEVAPARKRGMWDESTGLDGSSPSPSARKQPSSRPGKPAAERQRTRDRGPPVTDGYRTLEGIDDDTELKLQLDLPPERFVRHVATSPNPTVPRGRGAKLVGVALLVLGLGVGGWYALDWFRANRAAKPQPGPEVVETGMRKARVVGDGSAGYAGFRQRGMDLLVSENILYSYVRVGDTTADDPLAALVSGEAELALTTLDRVLLEHAGGRDPKTLGKIVAVVNVSLGDDVLVLDTVEHERLRSLGDLAGVIDNAELEPALAYAGGTPSAYFDLRLDALLVALGHPKLRHVGEFKQVRDVYAALVADSSGRSGPVPEGPAVVAALLREPWLSKAVDAGMTVAISSRDLPSAVVDVLVASPRTLAEQPELVDAVVGAYYEGIVAQQGAPNELITSITRELGLSSEEAARALAGSCLLDAVGAQAWLVAPESGEPLLAEAIEATWSTLRSHAKVSGDAPSLATLIDPRATTAAAAIERNLPVQDASGSLALCLANAKPIASPAQALGRLELPPGDAVWFVSGEATLTDAGKLAMTDLAARLRAFNPATISAEVTGASGLGGSSRAIGQARALAVVEHLRAAGVTLPLRTRGVAGTQSDSVTQSIRIDLSRTR